MTSPEEFSCIFCKESFESKEELQIHFRKHGDPKFNTSVKNSKGKVQSEMSAGGEKGEEAEMVQCDVCEEEFPTISKAITHKHKVHPDHDAKYFCPWCGKLFTMKHLYNKHIQSVHDDAEQSGDTGFHCDYCEVDFFVPSAMLYHNKFFHRQDTELAAIGHSRKLKLFGQEPLQIYYCPFCGEEYFNKINLHKHMGDDHIDENQCPEDVLRCPLCDAVFYHLDAYELHLTFHSTDDMYGEENEVAKDITEFSLETVPPMMEKVENESQEEENTSTLGIEELLQQAMNESNGESVREKKKKHKKHKRSKNAAITLDEFLNMNSDVFGEGLDVEGIVEVPTQVVAKSLKRKPGPKPLPTELQKLKKAGLVVKKNPAPVEGVKLVNKKPTLRPGLKIASQGNIISSEMKKAAEAAAKPNVASTSNDILTRLLNQGNSQIKIVKKSAQGDSISEISTTGKGPPETEDMKMKNTEIDSSTPNNNERSDDTSSTIKCMEEVPEVDSSIENHNDEENDNDAVSSQKSGDHSLKGTIQDEETIPESSIAGILNQDENIKESSKEFNNTKTKSSATTLDALRNISQHLTIKSLQSTGAKILEQEHKNNEESDTEHKDKEEDTKATQKDPRVYSPITDNKNKISPLKHLSHLTVKPITQSKNALSPSRKSEDLYNAEETEENHEDLKTDDVDNSDNELSGKGYEDDNISTKTAASVQNRPTNLEAFKNLSKHITIKSLSQSPNSFNNTVDKTVPCKLANQDINDSESAIDTDEVEKQQAINNNLSNKPIVKQAINTKSSATANSSSSNHSPKKINRVQSQKEVQIPKDQTSVKTEITANILKQFSNITAKPLHAHKSVKQSIVQTSSESMKILKGNPIQHNVKKIETSEEEIETFNIDDSDDEILPSPASTPCIPLNAKKPDSSTNTVPKHEDNKNTNEVLKNLNKHISIKVFSQTAKEELQDELDEGGNDKLINEKVAIKPQQKNIVLENKLKNLSNLTVKSSNTSPKLPTATPKQKIDLKQFDEYDSDCSNTSGNVKITELPNDYTSDDDVPLKNIEKSKMTNKDMGGADYTDSENENKGHHEDDDDIETKITSTILKKANKPAFLNNLKNITIKSSKDRQMQDEEEAPDSADENKVLVPFQPQNKPFQPSTSTTQEQRSPYEVKQNFGRPVKQNMSNCVNTVNKEVTVQKFQTKTVVQEITTTVTKTIRTINQSVKQEVQNVSQSSVMPTPPQRVQGIRPQIRPNFKGTPTRPVAPLMGTKIRNAAPTRLPGNTNIRPSNQLVQVKPGVNLARPNTPRMAGPKRFSQPSTSNCSNPIRKPLKISPNAMLNKRPTIDEVSGPFSCFKKPKESLIPSGEEEDSVQFASSSQMSQSNFTSTTKVMKGNSIVTSTQMKTEMSACSQQIKKLNNMAGLKVVKSNQVKQASHVEERSTISPAKRSAIEAIEKLQKQGLLVKKPKVEEPVVEEPDSEHEYSNPEDGDDYCDT